MIDPFAIAKMLGPNVDDVIEKKKLNEHDAMRRGEIIYMPKSILQKINQIRCLHENAEMDLKEVEIHDKFSLSVKITCTDCGREGWDWYEHQEREWK